MSKTKDKRKESSTKFAWPRYDSLKLHGGLKKGEIYLSGLAKVN